MKTLILASQSPTRKRILENAGFTFSVEPSDYEEDMTLAMPPYDLAKHLACGKAEDVAKKHIGEDMVILGADTFVVYEDKLLGKPHTPEKAKETLAMLSGKCHVIITGFCIIDVASGQKFSDTIGTNVYFRNLPEEEIDAYIATGEPLDKGGSYAIQEKGVLLVEKIEGTSANVAGLPIVEIAQILRKLGIKSF